MNKIINSISLLLLILLAAPHLSAQNDSIPAPKEGFDVFEVVVNGLGCPYCAFGLEKKMKELDGLKKFTIDIETGLTKFKLPAAAAYTEEFILSTVRQSGYSPQDIKIIRADGGVESGDGAIKNTFNLEEVIGEVANGMFQVSGNCGSCKNRIEYAANNIDGVAMAEWDEASQLLFVRYDNGRLTLESIKKAVAQAGHDTDGAKATDEVYNELPNCCKYRK